MQLWGDYSGNVTTDNVYGHDALGISIPQNTTGGLRCYVVLKGSELNATALGKTVRVSIIADGISITPNRDSNYSKMKLDVTRSTETYLSVAGNYFRSKNTSGTWSTLGDWEVSADGSTGWTTATAAPTNTALKVTIQATHTMKVNSAITQPSGRFYVDGTYQLDANYNISGGTTPVYGTLSTLKYNSGVTSGRGIEWTATASPANVIISSNTALNYPSGNLDFDGTINNDLTIDVGSALYMDFGDGIAIGSLTVKGDVLIDGGLTLGENVGGDLYVGGDYKNNGNFYPKGRAIFFNGTAKQTVSSTTIPLLVDYVINDNNSTDGLHINSPLSSINITNNGKLTIASGVTVLTSGTVSDSGTTNVQQALSSGRNWWYLASPVSNATSNVIAPTASLNKIGEHFENYIETPTDDALTTAPYYSVPFTAGSATALTVGKGYVVKFADTNAKTVTFTGGSLNTGDVSPTVTRTGTTAGARGFNLVGNPYPSYLNWKEVYEATTTQNMRPTIWYRTFSEITTENPTGMVFQTYNASLNVGVPSETNQYIAPMQAFWVKVNQDGITGNPPSSTGTLKFTNDNRDHAIAGTTTLLKTPALNDKQILRLQVINGTIKDEAVIVGVPEANDNYDLYDSEKMPISDTSMEIYTLAGTEKLVINGMNSLTEGKTVTLGFRPGQAGTNFTIEATQLDNIDAKIILVDKVAVKEQELTAETPYTFESDGTETSDRFLIKLVSKVPTNVESNTANGDLTVYVNRNNRIQLIYGIELNDQATVSVYNVAGQKLSTQKLSKPATELNGTFTPGVYMIQLTNGSQAITKKLIIR